MMTMIVTAAAVAGRLGTRLVGARILASDSNSSSVREHARFCNGIPTVEFIMGLAAQPDCAKPGSKAEPSKDDTVDDINSVLPP